VRQLARKIADMPRVLVVDDELLIGSTIKRLLRRDHEVVIAGSGAEGMWILLNDRTFDLILCDLMMPNVSGMDLYEWVAENHPGLLHRMVFITGGMFTPRAVEFITRVENIRIDKPFEADHLRRLIFQLLNRPSNPA
jgi:DNA-binding NtrC family response regulator